LGSDASVGRTAAFNKQAAAVRAQSPLSELRREA
jgi:anti-sigma B factor antagonist